MDAPRTIRFGDFVLNAERGCLEDRTGAERFLRPKSHRVLELLAGRLGQLVSKDDLVREAWPDVFVSDDSLAQCVSDIRRALGPEGARLLRTVPRRGYLLAAGSVSAEEPLRPSGQAVLARVGSSAVRSLVAGLVFAGLVVAAVSTWWLVPRSDLAVAIVPDAADLAVMQAHVLLQDRDWRRREHNEEARALLEAVVTTTPDHGRAWATLGLTYWLEVQHLAWGGGRREMAQALDMVERAVALGSSAEAYRLLAEMRLLAPFADMRSPVDALASARAAVAIDPEDPDNLAVLAHVLALTGRTDEAVRAIEQALRLDSTPPDWYRKIAGLSYVLADQPARAVEELGPLYGAGTFANARWWSGWLFAASLAHAGRIEEAEAIVRAAHRDRPEQSVAGVMHSFAGLTDPQGLAIVVDGLRRAGLPG